MRRTARPVFGDIAAALLGVGSTMTDLGSWFRGLRQPNWSPPSGCATIYVFTVEPGVATWRSAHRDEHPRLTALFAADAFLNVVGRLIFFRLPRPDRTLSEVAALWLSTVLLIAATRRRPRTAPLLLLYRAWVSFAGAFTRAIVAIVAPLA